MELHQLRSFITIVQEQSFTRAAEQLFVTQSALSQQIKTLEQRLGTPIFERVRRRIYLTEAGEILLNHARQMLALEAQIEEEISGLAGLTHGRLRIGTSDTTCLYLLPTVIQRFRQAYPAIEIRLTNRPSVEVIAALQERALDFGIITLPPASVTAGGELVTEQLLLREEIAICPPGHPLTAQTQVTLDDLVTYPLLLLDATSTTRAYLDRRLQTAHIKPRITDLGSIEVIKRYVEIGLGVSIVPQMAAEAEIQAGRLEEIPLPWLPPIAVGWVQRQGTRLSAAGETFYGMVKATVETDIE